MSERGASPGPFEMPEVASWRKLQVWLRGVHRGLGASRWRRPNMRMKLTRRPSLCSGRSQSSLGAQLMRYPLGGPRLWPSSGTALAGAVLLMMGTFACEPESPPDPSEFAKPTPLPAVNLSEIRLERRGGYGPFPTYSIVF